MFLVPRKNTKIKRKPAALEVHQLLARLALDKDAVDDNYGAFFTDKWIRYPAGKSSWHTNVLTGLWDREFYSNTKAEGTSTAGSVGNTVLEDTTANWDPGEWVGDEVFNLSQGPDGVVFGIVESNTATTITLASPGMVDAEGTTYNWALDDIYIVSRESVEKKSDGSMTAAQVATFMDTYNCRGLVYVMNLTMLKDDMRNDREWDHVDNKTREQFETLIAAIGIDRLTHVEIGNEDWGGDEDIPAQTELEYIGMCKYLLSAETGFTTDLREVTTSIAKTDKIVTNNPLDLRTRYPRVKWGALLYAKPPNNLKRLKWNKQLGKEIEYLIDAWIYHLYNSPGFVAERMMTSFKSQILASNKEVWMTEFGDNRQPTQTGQGEQYVKLNEAFKPFSHMISPYGVLNFKTSQWAFIDYNGGSALSGFHDGAVNDTVMADSGADFVTFFLVEPDPVGNPGVTNGDIYTVLYNITDRSFGTITAHTAKTITVAAGIKGGTNQEWRVNDVYSLLPTGTPTVGDITERGQYLLDNMYN
jgi:hypothetical protein